MIQSVGHSKIKHSKIWHFLAEKQKLIYSFAKAILSVWINNLLGGHKILFEKYRILKSTWIANDLGQDFSVWELLTFWTICCSVAWGHPVLSRMLSRIPGLSLPDASSTSPDLPSWDNQKCFQITKYPQEKIAPGWEPLNQTIQFNSWYVYQVSTQLGTKGVQR